MSAVDAEKAGLVARVFPKEKLLEETLKVSVGGCGGWGARGAGVLGGAGLLLGWADWRLPHLT